MKILINLDGEVEEFAFFTEESEEGEEVGEAEASEEVPNPVIPEINHVLWALVSFLVLWALMQFVLLPPILRQREERNAKIRADREAADKARAALGEVQADYDAALATARAEADGIIEEARIEAADHRAGVLGEANSEVAALRASAADGMDNSRTEAITSMRGDVGDIAVAAASAVLGKDLDRAAQQSAIDSALSGGDA